MFLYVEQDVNHLELYYTELGSSVHFFPNRK